MTEGLVLERCLGGEEASGGGEPWPGGSFPDAATAGRLRQAVAARRVERVKVTAVDVIVRATAVRWISDDFPGFIEVEVTDSHRRQHHIVEKVPVLTSGSITAQSQFPAELWIAAEMRAVSGDGVQVRLAHAVETTGGLRVLTLSAGDVVWL